MLTIKQPLIVNQKVLIDDVQFTIADGEHIALLGDNGIGKTTLLNDIAAQYDAGLLRQSVTHEESVLEFILQAHQDIYTIYMAMQTDNDRISDYIAMNGYELEARIVTELKKFGLEEAVLERSILTLSGGEQTKVSLIRLLLEAHPLLIFDEPTNHIDSETKAWLIDWVKRSKLTIIYASHDRDFINQTATKIVELTRTGARTFQLNYDDYKAQKDREAAANDALLDKERKEKLKMKQMIQEMKEWHHEANSKASVRDPAAQKKVAKIANRYKIKEHQLEQKQQKFKGVAEKKLRTDFSIDHSISDAKVLARFEAVSFSYNDSTLFKEVSFQINRGDKIVLNGKNGSGKSTLLKLLLGELAPDKGHVIVNPGTRVGYFSQQLETLNFNATVLDEIAAVHDDISEARTILAAFRFKAERMQDKTGDLSMGEKCRLAFVKLYFSDANLLVLDEPTNYFDIAMQEIVENMLRSYQGALLFVSHDQYFSSAVADRQLLLKDQQLIDLNMIIDDEIDEQQLSAEINDYLTLDYNPLK